MITGIADHFPSLTNLDLGYNKIFKVEAVEELHTLSDLAEVSFHENPICVHKHLKEMVSDVLPNIEVVNNDQLKEAGFKYKEELYRLKDSINRITGNQVGTATGDRLIAEAENDPEF